MSVFINNIEWQIVPINPNSIYLVDDTGYLTLGVTDCYLKKIFINKYLKGSLLRKVLIHEISHAWIFSFNYFLSVNEQEFICDFIASNADDIISKADELLYMHHF